MFTPTNDLNAQVIELMECGGIAAKVVEGSSMLGQVAINRTDMCKAYPEADSIPEAAKGAYALALADIRSLDPKDAYYISWSGKTDEVLYLDIYKKD